MVRILVGHSLDTGLAKGASLRNVVLDSCKCLLGSFSLPAKQHCTSRCSFLQQKKCDSSKDGRGIQGAKQHLDTLSQAGQIETTAL